MSPYRARRPLLRVGALLSLALLGCAPASARTGAPRAAAGMRAISQQEIDTNEARYTTAYELVRALRPGMLTARGATRAVQSAATSWPAAAGIKVYVDGIPFGGIASLAMISARDVRDVQWLSALDATTQFGTGNTAGAIVLTTRHGRR